MPIYDLTQAEADALIAMEKVKVDNKLWNFPSAGDSVHVPLLSADSKESFILDVRRGRIAFQKATYQNRAYEVIPLLRLDINGPPHRNPDDEEIPSPHLHIYREGYGDKWAFSLPQTIKNTNDLWETLYDFMGYCNISDFPRFQKTLLP